MFDDNQVVSEETEEDNMFEAFEAASNPTSPCAVFSGGESPNRVVVYTKKAKRSSQSIYAHTEMGCQVKWKWPHVL